MNDQTSIRLSVQAVAASSWAFVPLGLLLAACGGEPMSLGTNDAAVADPACGDGLSGGIVAQTQGDIDALAGCQVIHGGLKIIDSSASLDLAPLAELGSVEGPLSVEGARSLVGLEAVSAVNGLQLSGLLAPDLTPLRNLRSVGANSATNRLGGGAINIESSNALQDLAGLENVADWRDLTVIASTSLRSLSGLASPPVVGQVQVAYCPELTDASALSSVIEAQVFSFLESGISNFDGFQARRVDNVALTGNPSLTDLDGLDLLTTVQTLIVQDNDRLERAELPGLNEVQLISFTGNAVLDTVPSYQAAVGRGFYLAEGAPDRTVSVIFSQLAYEVGDNARLTRIALPFGYRDVQQVAIWGNPNLRQLDLGDLAHASGLLITDNPLLDSATSPSLERVGDLLIVDNPALSLASFANVQTFTREVSGNLDDLAP